MANFMKISTANTEFAFQLYREICSESSGNIFTSPFSVSVSMAMVLLGARDNTAKQLKAGMCLSDISDADVNIGNAELLKQTSSNDNDIVLNIANNLFPEKSYTLQSDFVESCLKFYQTKIDTLDFIGNPEGARNDINAWAEKETKGKIKNLLPSGSVNALTRLVLANAIYFKGEWMHKFEENVTNLTDFHVSESKIEKVQMMSQKRKFNISYDQELKLQVLELPYKGGKASLILLVPEERFGLKTLEDKLTSEKILSLMSQFSSEEVVVSLPRLKVEFGSNLIPVLKKLGIQDLFSAGKSNLQGVSGVPDLFVSGVYHKAFLEVNEEGSEAAAATAAVATLRCMPMPPVRVTCDHPFMFLIKHNPTNTVLFVGRFVSP